MGECPSESDNQTTMKMEANNEAVIMSEYFAGGD